MARIMGVVLAGGQATRMGGGDKCLLPLGGRPMLRGILARLVPQVDGIILNANGDPARFLDFGLPVVADRGPGFDGPLAGVLAGMEAAAEHGADRIVTVAGDTPFVPGDLVRRLVSAARDTGDPIAMAATAEPGRDRPARHPTFALWPVALAGDLAAALDAGTRKVVAWTDPHGCAVATFPTEPFDPFFNVNTPADLEHAERLKREYRL